MRLITTTVLALLMAATPALASEKTAQTKGNISLTTSLSNGHVLMPGDGTVHLAIDLAATDAKSKERLPMNLALVIDRSGSMRGDKLSHTKAAAVHLINKMTSKDTLAIVSYSDDVRVDLVASVMDNEVRAEALAAIEKINAGGSTNLSGGLFRGQEEVERNLRSGQVNRVILMSDGLANRGITDDKALTRQVQQVSQRGVTVTTMGVGADYNEDMMTSVADHAGGNYYFIQKPSAVASVFATELDKMSATVAQNTTVEVTLEDGVDLKQVFGYTFTRKGDVVSIPLAEMFSSQKRSILLEVQVPVVRTGRTKVGTVSIKYDDILDEGQQSTASLDLAVMVTRDKELVDKDKNKTVEERIEEVRVAEVMHRASDMLKEGRAADARKLIQGQMSATSGRAKGMGGSARLEQQVKDLEAMDDAFGEAEASPAAAPAQVKSFKAKARKLAR